MLHLSTSPVVRYIRKLAGAPDQDEASDGALLERFARLRDEEAFAGLVRRHGGLVLSVCRRVLQHEQDAEDAFQATFLVLARKAGSIKKCESVGSWLYGVAVRIARKAKAGNMRRASRQVELLDQPANEGAPLYVWQEIRRVLDEEVDRLPEKYRRPFLLCYLLGQTNIEAASQLGCKPGTIFSRLARARALLQRRLARRGLALPAGLFMTFLTAEAARAALPESLVSCTAQAATAYVVGFPASALSLRAVDWAKGALRNMIVSKLKLMTAVLLLGAVGGTGAGMWTFKALAANAANPRREEAANADKDGNGLTYLVKVPSRRDGVILLIGTEIAKGEKLAPEQTIKMKGQAYRRLKRGDRVEEGQLLVLIDDPIAGTEVAIKDAKVAAAIADQILSEKSRDEARKRFDTAEKLFQGSGSKVISLEDLRAAELTWIRFVYETKSKAEAVKVAQSELQQAHILLRMTEIHSPCRGIIQNIFLHRGEGVHALEPVLAIQVPEGSD